MLKTDEKTRSEEKTRSDEKTPTSSVGVNIQIYKSNGSFETYTFIYVLVDQYER